MLLCSLYTCKFSFQERQRNVVQNHTINQQNITLNPVIYFGMEIVLYSSCNSKHLDFRSWGKPWSYLQPTTDINGTLIAYHRKMDRRWWRAQVESVGLLNLEHHIILDVRMLLVCNYIDSFERQIKQCKIVIIALSVGTLSI